MRHGMNEYAADGTLLVNHGGHIANRFEFGRDNETAAFLGGIRETRHTVTASVRYEPIRNIVFDMLWRYHNIQNQTSTDSRHFVSLLLEIVY